MRENWIADASRARCACDGAGFAGKGRLLMPVCAVIECRRLGRALAWSRRLLRSTSIRRTAGGRPDGMAKLSVRRHFLMGLIRTVREMLGEEAAQRDFYAFCAPVVRNGSWQTGLSGIDMFCTMLRLQQCGWGLFDAPAIDPASGARRVLLRHSSFAADAGWAGFTACRFFRER
jgi:hypothetical protein